MNNSNEIWITLPSNGSDLQIGEWLTVNWQLYRDALDLSGDYFDRKSQVESTKIVSVDFEGSQVVINYQVEYSGFRACQDLRYRETSSRRVIGKRSDHCLIFAKHEPIERRSTADEL